MAVRGLAGAPSGSVFDESTIPDAIQLLERRQASLWHACQLIDLAAYLQLGGIGSRAMLERNELTFTPMASDGSDRRQGVWDRVFCSLEDIGHGFASGSSMTPNAFGPIVLQLAPSVLADATEATFSIGAATDGLSDPAALDGLFQYDADAGFPRSTWAAFGERLRDALPAAEAKSVEVLVSPRRDVLHLRHVVAVWVDPVTLGETQLIDMVAGLSESAGVPLRIRRRTLLSAGRADVWHEIVRLVEPGERPLIQLMNRADTSAAFRQWARDLHASRLDWLWDRFARYLREGTLRYLVAAQVAPAAVELDRTDADAGFWSASRRARAKSAGMVTPRAASALSPALPALPVRACGHPASSWENGACYACIGRSRARWRYED